MNDGKALVLLSGGQDSTTALFWAKREFKEVEAVTFHYEQRHREAESLAAYIVSKIADVPLYTLSGRDLSLASRGGNSQLLHKIPCDLSALDPKTDLPMTFVPGRNIFFLTLAAVLAYGKGINNLVTGVCQTDYSGYPDCRQIFIDSMQLALRQGMQWEALTIHTPFMDMTKAQEIHLARTLPGCWEALGYSHTCYEGSNPPCRECPACLLRAKGFSEAGLVDPLLSFRT